MQKIIYFSLNPILYKEEKKGSSINMWKVYVLSLIIYNDVLIIKKHFYFCKFLVEKCYNLYNI